MRHEFFDCFLHTCVRCSLSLINQKRHKGSAQVLKRGWGTSFVPRPLPVHHEMDLVLAGNPDSKMNLVSCFRKFFLFQFVLISIGYLTQHLDSTDRDEES